MSKINEVLNIKSRDKEVVLNYRLVSLRRVV